MKNIQSCIEEQKFINHYNELLDAFSEIISRTNIPDEIIGHYKIFYPTWRVGIDYELGQILLYNGSLYRVGQNHTSQEQWAPGDLGTDSLYSKIEIVDDQYEVWQVYDGVSGVYSKDQIVVDPNDRKLYISKIDVNVWGPPSEQPDCWAPYSE